MKLARRALDGFDDDIRDHIQRETEDNIDRGMEPDEARRQAMLKFGNIALTKEDTRARGWQRLEHWFGTLATPFGCCGVVQPTRCFLC